MLINDDENDCGVDKDEDIHSESDNGNDDVILHIEKPDSST